MPSSPYQYIGEYGVSQTCLHAVRVIITGGYLASSGVECGPTAATLITRTGFSVKGHGEHAFVFWDWILPITVVPSGFASGYSGEGSRALALALMMMRAKDIPVYEVGVDGGVFSRLNRNRLSDKDISFLERTGRTHELSAVGRYLDIVDLSNSRDEYAPLRFCCERRIAWEWLDYELAESCEGLAKHNLRSSLIEAFLVLKSRLVTKFGVPDSSDGDELVNKVFAKDGILCQTAGSDEERKRILAMRDPVSGLYKVFRNGYGHKQAEVSLEEAEAVLSMINLVLRRLDGYPLNTSPATAKT